MRVRRISALPLVVLALGLLAACDEDESETLRVGTYNAGLAPGYVPLSEERAPETIAAIARQDLDVFCVQEIWRTEDARALQEAGADRWPHRIVPAPQPAAPTSSEPACEAAALAPIQTCAASECAGVATGTLASCVLARCDAALTELSSECAGCLASQIGASLPDIVSTCTTEPSGALAFGGSFGLGLLSRYPILEQDLLVLDATFNRRGVIHARLDTPEAGQVHVFCTHLTAIFDDVPYPGPGSWEAEQRAQIEALLAFVAEKTGGEGPAVLLGDLNTGPRVSDIEPEAPDNYALLLRAFRDPHAEDTDDVQCTFCPDNPLVPEGTRPVLIDHVLVRDLDGPVRRFFTEPIQIDVGGTRETTALSDHYGVRAALRRP
jgi:endonuclease/exonuclease/phosphatase family metal-dependent hydrolase